MLYFRYQSQSGLLTIYNTDKGYLTVVILLYVGSEMSSNHGLFFIHYLMTYQDLIYSCHVICSSNLYTVSKLIHHKLLNYSFITLIIMSAFI